MLKIFIGWDSRFPIVSNVLHYSILRNNLQGGLDIIELKKYQFTVRGFNFKEDKKATTEFTYTRFLIPWLCSYDDIAIFMDNDMLCYYDISALIDETEEMNDCAIEDKALFVRKHPTPYIPERSVKMYGCPQTSYPRKNWSSLMIMNCEMLRCWTPEVVCEADGARLHQFKDIPDVLIGDIPIGWNDLTHKTDRTRLLHYTEGGPWYPAYKNCPHAEDWTNMLKEMQE